MAQPELRQFDQRGIVIGLAGEALLPATHALLLRDGSSSTTADRVERNLDTTHLGAKPASMKNHRAMIEGNIELPPPAAPGQVTTGVAPCKRAVECCGLAQTLSALLRVTRLSPVSSGFVTSDAYWWHAGLYLEVFDMAGELSELKMEIGSTFMAKVAYEGNYNELDEDALPNDFDLSAYPEPTVAEYNNSTLIINSLGAAAISNLHLRAKMLQATFGNTKAVHEYTEYKKGQITKRDGKYTIRIALTELADLNPDALKRSREFFTAEWMLREPDGRYSVLGIRGQVDDYKIVDIDGKAGFEITGPCVPSDTGNDEIWVEYGDSIFGLNGTLLGGAETVVYVANGLTASGEFTAPIAWDISVGALPAGLTINAATGSITGTPTTAGVSNFTVRATDSSVAPKVATKASTITIIA